MPIAPRGDKAGPRPAVEEASPAEPLTFHDVPGERCDLGRLFSRTPEGRRGEYERTAENILAQLATRRPSVLLLLGMANGEEDCAVSVRLAAALTRQVASDVLLVECTFQDSLFPQPSRPRARRSLVDVLTGRADWRDAVSATSVPSLHVLRGARFPGDGQPPDGLQCGPLLDQLRREYRLVLALAGTSANADVLRVARHCDGTYLLVSLHRAARRAAKEALRRVARCGGQVLGCVVTDA